MKILKSFCIFVFIICMSFSQSYAKDIKTSADLLNEIAKSSNKHVVLVNFYASWCPPCGREIKELIELRKQFSEDTLRIIGINLDDEKKTMFDFNRRAGINYKTYHDFQGNISNFFGFQTIPFNMIYSKSGKAIYADSGAIPINRLKEIIEYGLTK